MKVARTVPRGGSLSNNITYLNRPYAALLLLVIECDWLNFNNKVDDAYVYTINIYIHRRIIYLLYLAI